MGLISCMITGIKIHLFKLKLLGNNFYNNKKTFFKSNERNAYDRDWISSVQSYFCIHFRYKFSVYFELYAPIVYRTCNAILN